MKEEQELPLEQEENNNALKVAQEEAQELKDKLLRTMAEAENARKRSEKALEDARNFAISNFAKDLLNVADNLSRALTYKPQEMSEEVSNIIQGVEMTRQEMINIFTKYKMKEISPSIGEKFDYNLHYAVTQVPNAEYSVGTILQLVQPGYMIGDRLLRPATVTVTKAPDGD